MIFREATGADLRVVELFAIFHDACRTGEGVDHGHGRRAARLAPPSRAYARPASRGYWWPMPLRTIAESLVAVCSGQG